MKLTNKTILITGISRGLGLELAKHWYQDNIVIGMARHHPPEPTLEGKIHFYPCDFGNEKETQEQIQKITTNHPQIDLLINNAAVLTSLPLAILKTQDITKMIDVNLKAPIMISKQVFRKMLQTKSGQIVNILSMASKLSIIGDSVYAATKAGLEAFGKVLNKEGHPYGIHVNNIGLSAFPSGMLDKLITNNPDKILGLIPHQQYAELEDIVRTIEFFCANSRDVGGQTVYLGGV